MKYLIKEYRLTNIANAIRRRTGIDREIILSEMPELIESIFTNDIYPNTLIDKDTDLLQYYIEEESLKAIANAIRNKIASTDLMTIEQMPELIASFVYEEPSFKVTYNANGGSFTNSNITNEVEYTYSIDKIVKTSKTPNVSDDGLTADTTTGYGNSIETTDVITIPGSKSLEVTITYQTEAGASIYDWVSLYDGSITPSSTNYDSSISGRLSGKIGKTETFTIPGNTV